jgi:hypothetical protein
VSDALANLCLLARRSADLKGVELRVEPADKSATLQGSPFAFGWILYLVIEGCLESTRVGTGLDIRERKRGDNVVVQVEGCHPEAPAHPWRGQIERLLPNLRGRVRWPDQGEQAHIELEFGA